MARCGFPALRQKLAELGKKDGMASWLDEARRRVGAIYERVAPVVANAANAVARETKVAATKAGNALNSAAAATTTVFRGTIAPTVIQATEKAKVALRAFLANFGKH